MTFKCQHVPFQALSRTQKAKPTERNAQGFFLSLNGLFRTVCEPQEGGLKWCQPILWLHLFTKMSVLVGEKKKKKGHFSIIHVTYWKMRTNVTSQNDASFFPLMAKNENRTDFELPKLPAQSQAHMGIWVRCQSSPIHERTAPQFILRKPRTEPPEFVFFVSCSSEHLLGRGPYWFEKVNSLHPTSKIIRGSVVLIKRNTG